MEIRVKLKHASRKTNVAYKYSLVNHSLSPSTLFCLGIHLVLVGQGEEEQPAQQL